MTQTNDTPSDPQTGAQAADDGHPDAQTADDGAETARETPAGTASATGLGGSEDAEARAKLWSLIKDIGIAMMTSLDGEVLRSRPMHTSQDTFEGTLWFFSRKDSHKTEEIAAEEQVNLAYADPREQIYVSVSGAARMVSDPALIRELWDPRLKPWFPGGAEDDQLVLIKVVPEQAEYWDMPKSRARQIWQSVRSRLTPGPREIGEHRMLPEGDTDR